jgi:branched-chain amino acid transport system permease protein
MAFVVCALLATLVSVPLFRTRGLYFLIVGLTITGAVVLAENNWVSVTGGSNGLTWLTPPQNILGLTFNTPGAMFRLFLVMTVAITLGCWLVGRSGFGDRLQAIRDNEVLARSLGLPVKRYLIIWFAVTGGLSGIAGVMFLYETLAVAPSLFTGLATAVFPIMVILGGSRSLAGPIVGAFMLAFLPHWLSLGQGFSQVLYGGVLILVILALPEGVVPSFYVLVSKVTRALTREVSVSTGRSPNVVAAGIELARSDSAASDAHASR